MSRGRQRVSIKCRSQNGAIKVLLPRDFTGLVGYRTHNGTTLFSPAVKAATTTFSVTRGVGKCFIGDWQHANFNAEVTRTSLEATRSEMSPTETDTGSYFSSGINTHEFGEYQTHVRHPSTSSSIHGYESPPRPDPQVRVWSPNGASCDEFDRASSSPSPTSGGISVAPYRSPSVVSSSTLLPSQSASQVGTGQNLSPHLQPSSPYPSGMRTPTSRPTTPTAITPSTVSNSNTQRTSDSLLDDASLAWEGDLLEVDTVNGTIRIAFVDEPKDHSKTSTLAIGAARLVKGWLAEKGINTDKIAGLTREASGWVKGT